MAKYNTLVLVRLRRGACQKTALRKHGVIGSTPAAGLSTPTREEKLYAQVDEKGAQETAEQRDVDVKKRLQDKGGSQKEKEKSDKHRFPIHGFLVGRWPPTYFQ